MPGEFESNNPSAVFTCDQRPGIIDRTFRYSFACRAVVVLMILLAGSSPVVAKKSADKNTESVDRTPRAARQHLVDAETPATLPDSVKKLLKKHRIKRQDLSIYIRNLNAPKPLLELNADRLRTPASTMKLLTTYAALKALGPNYTWRTEAWIRGPLKKGILHGDLILKGYGDPFLVQEQFWKLLSRLRDKGLREIRGTVIVDNSYFELPPYDSGAFDNQPFRVYNAPPSALMFNFQATRFLFRPEQKPGSDQSGTDQAKKSDSLSDSTQGADNKKVETVNKAKNAKTASGSDQQVDVTAFPSIRRFRFENRIKLTHGRCRKSHYRPRFLQDKQGGLIIKGNYSSRCKQQFILRAVSKPHEHLFNAFRDTWNDLGGKHRGDFRQGRVTSGDELFHVHSSPTLGVQMALVNKWSNNVMTRQVLLTLGAKKYNAPGTPQKGERAILEILEQNGLDTGGITIENGSGLSRTAKLSARQLGNVLENAFRDAYMPEFIASMALSGVDGTMVNRFRRDDLRGRGHFKTGTLNGVSAIAGYMLNRQGKRMVIVIIQNGKKTGAGRSRKIQDALLRWSFEQ